MTSMSKDRKGQTIYTYIYMGVPLTQMWRFPEMGVPLFIIHKPTILGYCHLWKPPYIVFSL